MAPLIQNIFSHSNCNMRFSPRDVSWTLQAAIEQGEFIWLSSSNARATVSSLRSVKCQHNSSAHLTLSAGCFPSLMCRFLYSFRLLCFYYIKIQLHNVRSFVNYPTEVSLSPRGGTVKSYHQAIEKILHNSKPV